MFIETALKNIALNTIMTEIDSSSVYDMYDKAISSYKNAPAGTREDIKKKYQNNKLNLQGSIQNAIAAAYRKENSKITHFYNNLILINYHSACFCNQHPVNLLLHCFLCIFVEMITDNIDRLPDFLCKCVPLCFCIHHFFHNHFFLSFWIPGRESFHWSLSGHYSFNQAQNGYFQFRRLPIYSLFIFACHPLQSRHKGLPVLCTPGRQNETPAAVPSACFPFCLFFKNPLFRIL